MPTLQETFDIVVAHARKQGCKSMDGGICLYRGPNGLKCWAGILIPDEEYVPEMEHMSISQIGLARTCILNQGHDIALVEELQRCHDDFREDGGPLDLCRDLANWEKGFALVADKWGLQYCSTSHE